MESPENPGFDLGDLRKRMNVDTLEALLFLKVNMDLWDIGTVAAVMKSDPLTNQWRFQPSNQKFIIQNLI